MGKFHFIEVLPAPLSILHEPGMVVQRKFDGTAAEVFKNERNRIFGKRNEYTERFPELIRALDTLNIPGGTDFLAEIIVINPKTGQEDLSLVQLRMRESGVEFFAESHPALLVIHDAVTVSGRDVSQLGYFERMNALRSCTNWHSSSIFFIRSSNDGVKEWEYVEQHRVEGLIVRDPLAPLGKRVWKVKREFTEDVYCTGMFTPSDSDTLSSRGLFANLVCYQITPGGKEIHVADVGGGFTLQQRKEIQAMLNRGEITKENPLVIEVKANARYEDGKLRNPTFKRIRYDKLWKQCIIYTFA